ncbi:TIGR03435 family protein [Granulicella sp. dw_53]|uniref:TIGR03435 family protein n=1 Tax=Granulicella sp. dw_53 TaxID=2719792 RepID=UPI001BD4B5F1|nr:TIGR03435 family protein [Granulicella sp. dw_53]
MIDCGGRRLAFTGRLLPIVALSLAFASFAQTSVSPSATSPGIDVPPVTDVSLVFEVATIKQNKSGDSGSRSTLNNGRFIASNTSLKNLIQYQAYGIPESRILGGPKWLNSERFDIEAKVDASALERLRKLSRGQQRLQRQGMFQQLLAERFKLATHWETRELPVYALVGAKNKLSLLGSKELEGSAHVSTGNGEFNARGVTLAQLSEALTQELYRDLGRPVIDLTGIDGRYDVTLKWTPETGAASIKSGADGGAAPPDAGPSIFTAIQEQLGLKLESTKGPVKVLVIDHVEMPSEN